MAFVKAMRTYTKDCEKHADADEDAKARLLTRYFCLFGANSGMRYGEQMNLLWENVQVETQNVNKRETQIAKVLVAIGTSKKRHKSRDFWCRGGEYIERWQAIAKHNDQSGYVFSMNGQSKFPKTSFHRHWNRIMELAEIDEQKKQHIVPYSLRYFCVSQRIMAGLSFADVAQNLGTSVFHVESTYNHLQDEVRKRFAHADYKMVDGVAMPLIKEVL